MFVSAGALVLIAAGGRCNAPRAESGMVTASAGSGLVVLSESRANQSDHSCLALLVSLVKMSTDPGFILNVLSVST